METTSRPLAVESFSDSWLSNTRPSLIKVLDKSNTNSFDFDTSISDKSPVNFVHADELFSDGLIKPVFVDPINGGVSSSTSSSSKSTTDSDIFALSSLSDPRTSVTDQDVQMGCSCCFFRRRRRLLSEQVLRKIFGYLIRTRRAKVVGGSKKSTKVDDIDRRTLEVKSWSSCSSPGPSTVYDIESSIYEAVLHCKRSIGK
ncbi:probable membrane-associated kinase regulator 6 [Morus notabilis]|uniref:probable membrane-associated kinase regulator 6 n=1 Tax=Morus notabilis TaxID=981085 RepID=UPI000CED62E4|nr:probable membrane-associated kinase regulator 6 [Morus notabilis]